MFYFFTARETDELNPLQCRSCVHFPHILVFPVLVWMTCWILTSVLERWSSLTVCWSLLFVVPAVVLNVSLWGIEFKFNNTTKLIVPNKIICLLAKTLPGICISGNPGRGNKETNQQELPNLFSFWPNFWFRAWRSLFTVNNHLT